jgi:hypothetical protein
MAGKLEKELVLLLVAGVPPQVFEDMDEPAALLQSMPVLCMLLPYDGVVAEDIILFILIVGRACCCGGAKVGLPIPGLEALKAGKDELSVLSVLSGVMERPWGLGAERFVVGGGDTGGVDHENVAAGDALLDLVRLLDGRDGRTVEVAEVAEAFPHVSPPSISVPPLAPGPPRTSASKSVSPFPLLDSKPLLTDGPPKVMNSLRVVAVELFAPNSCSFRVCSFSTRAEVVLMRLI